MSDKKANQNFYNHFYKKSSRTRAYFKEYDFFLELIGETNGKVIMSIGNGDKEPFFDGQIVSDIAFEGIKKVSKGKRIVFDAHHIPFKDDSIDIIYGWQTTHHLDIDKLFPQLKNVLKKNGKAVFVDNAYAPQWRGLRKLLPKKEVEPKEDLREDYLYDKAREYGFNNFRTKRFNFFAYLFNKAMRELGIDISFNFLVTLDTFCCRWKVFRNNLRNMVWSIEK